MRARDVLGEGGQLARAIDGYEHRPSQIAMAEIVERALEHEGVALIEAGTGTGKTLGYLVPAVLSDKRIVISTGTRNLQDQIAQKDVPALARALGRDLPIVALKGLPNYVCLRRYNELLGSADSVSRPEISRPLAVIQEWMTRSETGDRAELVEIAEDAPIWAAIQSASDTRIGPRCRYYDDCYVTKARERAAKARIVVVNHHLFFADLVLRAGGGGVIPDYEAVIFDEAHQIEDVATGFFGVQLGTQRLEVLVRDADRALAALGALDPITLGLFRTILLHAQDAFERLPRPLGFEGGRTPLPKEVLDGGVRDALFALDVDLEALADVLRDKVSQGEGLTQIIRRADAIRDAIGTVCEPGSANVTWIQHRGRNAWVGASPVDVSSLFRDEVLHRVRSVVFTSATLATGDSFAFTKARLGIDFEVDEVVLPSPFDFPKQAALYLPELPDPRDPDFLGAAAGEIDTLIALTGGGAFVLSTSVRMMNELARRLRASIESRGLVMMVQGEAPKNAQLERFRALEHAVLFATQSFWEGVDVPGHALRLVVIDKLPFEVPSDPLVAARSERVGAEGGNAFMDYLVPSAALALKQGFGRLVRSSRDRGIVALLDARIRRKGYGKVFLRSLPDARRCTTFEEVESFWRG